jgi:hypothetical protein
VLDKAKNYIAVHGNRNRDELHARSYPAHASTAENISRVDVSNSVAVLDECAGCNVLKTQIATQDARIATQDAHIADMRASQAARDGYLLVRDLIQDSLNALMFLVKGNLKNEIRMKCTLNAMQCAYDFSVTN